MQHVLEKLTEARIDLRQNLGVCERVKVLDPVKGVVCRALQAIASALLFTRGKG